MAIKLTEMQKSALLEAGNIGSGHAAIALSQIMGRKIMIAIPSIEVFELENMVTVFGKDVERLLLVKLVVLGDVKGVMVFVIEEKDAHLLCDIVMGQIKGVTKKLKDLEISALKEVGSIVSASYLNALSEMTMLNLIVSIPDCSVGNINELKDKIKDKGTVTEGICIKTEFIEAEIRLDGYLIFVPAENAIAKIVSRLGV